MFAGRGSVPGPGSRGGIKENQPKQQKNCRIHHRRGGPTDAGNAPKVADGGEKAKRRRCTSLVPTLDVQAGARECV